MPPLFFHYNGIRYHGRFTTRDRFKGFENRPASQNAYTYCENDPVNNIDSNGYFAAALIRGAMVAIKIGSKIIPKISGWIKHSVYNEIRNRFGKEGVEKFIEAMNKGIVGPEGESGIKALSGQGIKIGNQFYKYEIKVKGKFGDWRVYGNFDEKQGKIIFTLLGKGQH